MLTASTGQLQFCWRQPKSGTAAFVSWPIGDGRILFFLMLIYLFFERERERMSR